MTRVRAVPKLSTWLLALACAWVAAQGVLDAPEVGLPDGLRPPTSTAYGDPAWYDLVAVRWVDADSAAPTLEIELGAIDPSGPGPLGMLQPIVEVYVDDGGGGAATLLPGSGLRMPDGDGWRYAVRVTGDGAWWWHVDPDDGLLKPPQPLEARVEGRVVSLAWPVAVPPGARLYGISGVHDPFSPDGWRRFANAPSPWAFAAEEAGPPVVDVLPGDADAWREVRATGALLRPPAPAGVGVGDGSLRWWLLMAAGLGLAIGGLVWRFFLRAVPAGAPPAPARPAEPTTASEAASEAAAEAASEAAAEAAAEAVDDAQPAEVPPGQPDPGEKAATAGEESDAAAEASTRTTDAPSPPNRSANRS